MYVVRTGTVGTVGCPMHRLVSETSLKGLSHDIIGTGTFWIYQSQERNICCFYKFLDPLPHSVATEISVPLSHIFNLSSTTELEFLNKMPNLCILDPGI
jgi:hypothetical protein